MEDDQMILAKTGLWDELSKLRVDAPWRPVANVVGRMGVILFAALKCRLSLLNVVVTVIAKVGLIDCLPCLEAPDSSLPIIAYSSLRTNI
jgi:hypothetical protein